MRLLQNVKLIKKFLAELKKRHKSHMIPASLLDIFRNVIGSVTLSVLNNDNNLTDIVGSICNELGIPHILANWFPEDEVDITDQHQFTRNFFPDNYFYAKALSQIVNDYMWKGFTLIYENNDCTCCFLNCEISLL